MTTETRKYSFVFLSLFIFLIIIYSNSFHCSWHLDDAPNIVDNQNVHLKSLSWDHIKKSFYGIHYDRKNISRPLAYFTFALNYYFNGTGVFGYHVVNFAIHYLTAIILFLLIYNTLQLPALKAHYSEKTYAIALFSVFFWAVHPIQITAVTYIVQRMASMAGMFYVLAMYFYLKGRTVKGRKNRAVFFLSSFAAAACAVASKENALMLPVSIGLYEAFFLEGLNQKKPLTVFTVIVVTLLGILLLSFILANPLSILAGYQSRPFTLEQRLLTEPRVILFYLSLLIYPLSSRLTLLHDFEISRTLFAPWTTLPAIVCIVLMISAAVWLRRRRPLFAFCILFFFINHLIEGSLVPLELVFEHRNYIPSMFLFVPLAVLAIKIFDYFANNRSIQMLLSATVVLFLVSLGDTTYFRNQIFLNDLTLWTDNVKKAPGLQRPHHNLGLALLTSGLYEESLVEMHKALAAKAGPKINQEYRTYHNLGIYYLNQNEYDKALGLFLKALELQPNNYKSFIAISRILLVRNQTHAAEKYIDIARRLNPYSADAYYIQGLIMLKKGKVDAAIQAGQKALELNVDDQTPFFLLAEAFRLKNKLTESANYFKKYLEQYPEQISAHLALIELHDLLNNPQALKESVLNLMRLIGKRNFSEIVLTYHEKDNYLDDSRIKRIVNAVQHYVVLPSEEIKGLLTRISHDTDQNRKTY